MKKYDLIIPVGATCKTSHNLRQFKRQNESLPFDWVLTLSLDKICRMLSTRFAGFLQCENMEYKCKESEQTDIYFDKATGIGFWHDFPHDIPLEQSFDAIKKKYNRRIERLFAEISRARDILLFRVNTVRPQSGDDINGMIYAKSVVDDETLRTQFSRIQSLFPDKNIDLLEVSLFNEPHEYRRRQLEKNIVRIEVFSDIRCEWQGDPAVFKDILSDFKLKPKVVMRYKMNSLLFKMRRFFINIGAFLGVETFKQNKRRLKNRFNR